MPNLSMVKHPMPEQEPAVRAKNFKEVALGYTRETAMEEADRCLNCKNSPCVTGCPVNVPIPAFIAKIREGDTAGAYALIRSQNALPAICGRVCPQESQCESKCVRGIKGVPVAIGRLERFAADTAMAEGTAGSEKKDMPFAFTGSGTLTGLDKAPAFVKESDIERLETLEFKRSDTGAVVRVTLCELKSTAGYPENAYFAREGKQYCFINESFPYIRAMFIPNADLANAILDVVL